MTLAALVVMNDFMEASTSVGTSVEKKTSVMVGTAAVLRTRDLE